jgi:3-oxoacyl-[acyl-carrier protein] reductase
VDLGLKGRAAFVTGASGGIGRAIAEAFAAEGCNVICHAFRGAEALKAWLGGRPWKERGLLVAADARRPAELEGALWEACRRFGRVDICVANAGTRPDRSARLDEAPEERIRATVESNLLASAFTARAFLASLARTPGDGSALLFIGSTAATFGERGYADYAMAKAGLLGLMLTLKNEIVALDPRGRVNLLVPGWTATHVDRPALRDLDLVRRAAQTMPLRQIARADDIARAAVWLCSPAARHVSGQALTIAGGMEGRVLWQPGEVDPEAIRRDARGE